ncbi:MAG: cell division protein ZapD [bacterium]
MKDHILFEHPLNEKCRTLLRLSNLFEQLAYHSERDHPWDSRAAIKALLEISAILARPDIKSDLLKELDHYEESFMGMANSPGVDRERLDLVLRDLVRRRDELGQTGGQLGQALRNDDFLKSISQRSGIPGGCFEFDLPQLHYWLQLPQQSRAEYFAAWRKEVRVVEQTTLLLLSLIRHSQIPSDALAENGIYNHNLDPHTTTQMIRVKIPRSLGLYAEVSGSKHRFTIRFFETNNWESPGQTKTSVPFKLTICTI